MNRISKIICFLLIAIEVVAALGAASLEELPVGSVISCEGGYKGHIQGMTINKETIYWSFASTLVKTDQNGKVLKSISTPNHCGDPCWANGALYVPHNGGAFNSESGNARNFILVYNSDLELIRVHYVPELVYGAGCMEFHKGKFYVAGGLPDGKKENYIYEYDAKFRFIKRHVIPVSSKWGVQTIKYAVGSFWLGCYGPNWKNFCVRVDETFQLKECYDYDTSMGSFSLGGTADCVKLIVAKNIVDPQTKLNRVRAIVAEVADGKFRNK